MKRFTIVQNGYNVEEVNRFIDIVIKRLEKLNNDNSLLQVKISWESWRSKIIWSYSCGPADFRSNQNSCSWRSKYDCRAGQKQR